MAMANINKQHFLLAGRCAVVLSVFSRSSVGKIGEGIRGVKEIGILIKVIFSGKSTRISFGSNKQRKASARQMLRPMGAEMFG